MTLRMVFLAALLLAPVPSLAQAPTAQPTERYAKVDDPAVLESFGGVEGLRRFMELFEAELAVHPQTKPFFGGRDNTRVKQQLVDQFCDILGGGCVYRGQTMRDSHRGMGVSMAAFIGLVEAFQRAADRHGVPFRYQNKLLSVLAPMYRDIVTR
ncbi:MAG: group 1 truncated hemoglobin [Alphaproteobacteria bacterium]|nr:group 1 truncated hemoglobin [Alphaproteobacteria bacterium]